MRHVSQLTAIHCNIALMETNLHDEEMQSTENLSMHVHTLGHMAVTVWSKMKTKYSYTLSITSLNYNQTK